MNTPARPSGSQPRAPYTPSRARIALVLPSSASRRSGLNLSPAIRSVPPSYPVHFSPVRRKKVKKRTVYNQTDEEVWDLQDDVIIGEFPLCVHCLQAVLLCLGACLERWTAPCYAHYTVTLRRDIASGKSPLGRIGSRGLYFTLINYALLPSAILHYPSLFSAIYHYFQLFVTINSKK